MTSANDESGVLVKFELDVKACTVHILVNVDACIPFPESDSLSMILENGLHDL
jgi:hypothetical protein